MSWVIRRNGCALIVVAVLLAGCANSAPKTLATQPNSKLCRVFHSLPRHPTLVTERLTRAQVRGILRAANEGDARLAAAATGSLRAMARAVQTEDARYNARLLSEWPASGTGRALHRKANEAGFYRIGGYLDSLVFGDSSQQLHDSSKLADALAVACDGLRVVNPPRLSPSKAPAGELLAVKLGTGEIHRFSTSGRDLGTLDLPGVEPVVQQVVGSRDGRWLAFTAGDPRKLWVLDLTTGEVSSTTAVSCLGWGTTDADLWAEVNGTVHPFIARIFRDGNYDHDSRLDLDGCPSNYSSTELLVQNAPVDGGPIHLDVVPMDGGHRRTLVSTPCGLANGQMSPEGSTLAFQTRCHRDADSGLTLTDRRGKRQRVLVPGITGALTWSPDSRWLAFSSLDRAHPGDTSQVRLNIVSRDGRTRATVTPPGYSWPIWLPGPPGMAN